MSIIKNLLEQLRSKEVKFAEIESEEKAIHNNLLDQWVVKVGHELLANDLHKGKTILVEERMVRGCSETGYVFVAMGPTKKTDGTFSKLTGRYVHSIEG